MSLLMEIFDNYSEVNKLSDDRTKGWLMVDSFWNMLLAIVTYNGCIWFGVKFMKNRRPFELKKTTLIYNICATLLNAYIFLETCTTAINLNNNFICNERSKTNRDPLEMRMASVTWIFYMAKYFELLDTMFIVLKKKERNLSFLHIYHHSTVVIIIWTAVKWFPTGDTYIPIALNSAVHIVMYSYYALSCLGPKVSKYLWWKKYLTILQLVQFGIGVALMSVGFLLGCGDVYPGWYIILWQSYATFYIFLFGKFYVNSYYLNKNKKKL